MSEPVSSAALDAELSELAGCIDPAQLASPFGVVECRGAIRVSPRDFCVAELPLEQPSGDGEHAWLHIRKEGNNTAWVAKKLADFAAVDLRDVSYAGLKDRNAITEQWFSVWLPGRPDPDWAALDVAGVVILDVSRHRKKLRRGDLAGNRFALTVREFEGDAGKLAARCVRVAKEGVPNYFGAQRFGRGGGNLRLLADGGRLDRDQRSMAYSALRSGLFNNFLKQRVIDGFWNQCEGDSRAGDVPLTDRDGDIAAYRRLCGGAAEGRPTGPLWGEGRGRLSPAEEAFFGAFPQVTGLLNAAGLKRHRRSLWLPVSDLQQSLQGDSLNLAFTLPPGAFATTVLDMLLSYQLGSSA
jgi:tRNA pseudouridine13 synthase